MIGAAAVIPARQPLVDDGPRALTESDFDRQVGRSQESEAAERGTWHRRIRRHGVFEPKQRSSLRRRCTGAAMAGREDLAGRYRCADAAPAHHR